MLLCEVQWLCGQVPSVSAPVRPLNKGFGCRGNQIVLSFTVTRSVSL